MKRSTTLSYTGSPDACGAISLLRLAKKTAQKIPSGHLALGVWSANWQPCFEHCLMRLTCRIPDRITSIEAFMLALDAEGMTPLRHERSHAQDHFHFTFARNESASRRHNQETAIVAGATR